MIDLYRFETMFSKSDQFTLVPVAEDKHVEYLMARTTSAPCSECGSLTPWVEKGPTALPYANPVPVCSFLCFNNRHGFPIVTLSDNEIKLTQRVNDQCTLTLTLYAPKFPERSWWGTRWEGVPTLPAADVLPALNMLSWYAEKIETSLRLGRPTW